MENSNYGMTYNVDIVLCIDATGSMTRLIDGVKQNAINFYDDVRTNMEEKGKKLSNLRVRCIAFRDYGADGDKGMLATGFYSLPEKKAEFSALINSIEADGGGDIPEDAFEALAHAMRSDWTKEGSKRRHIIALWTDAPAHPLGFSASKYPAYNSKNFPKDLGELTKMWRNMDANAKRIIIFGPESGTEENSIYWGQVRQCGWSDAIYYNSVAGEGLSEIEYSTILATIVNSI